MIIDDTLEQRGKVYGEFREQAKLAQSLKEICREHENWACMDNFKKEAIEMVLHKIARIVNGNSNYLDSWNDCVGYLQLATDEITDSGLGMDSITEYFHIK